MNNTALVTGATGFVGGRLVEQLLEEGVQVRALVRDFSKAVRLSRRAVEFVHGDVLDCASVTRASQGCQVIFHCAHGNRGTEDEQKRANELGALSAIEAARQNGARLVHVSSLAVYDAKGIEVLDETTAIRTQGDFYAMSKLAAEQSVLAAVQSGLDAVVVQPTIIYGPFSPFWSYWLAQRLVEQRFVLPDAQGLCNCIYVDDVVQGLIAAWRRGGRGERYLLTGESLSWERYLNAYADALGVPRVVFGGRDVPPRAAVAHPESVIRFLLSVLRSSEEVRVRFMHTREVAWIRAILHRLLPLSTVRRVRARLDQRPSSQRWVAGNGTANEEAFEDARPLFYPDPSLREQLSTRYLVEAKRAALQLNWAPKVSVEDGLKRTGAWLRWMCPSGMVPL